MAENATRIKSGIRINVGLSVKIPQKIMRAKKIIFGILLPVAVKMVDILEVFLTIQ